MDNKYESTCVVNEDCASTILETLFLSPSFERKATPYSTNALVHGDEIAGLKIGSGDGVHFIWYSGRGFCSSSSTMGASQVAGAALWVLTGRGSFVFMG